MTEHTIPDSTLDTTVTADPQVTPGQHTGEKKPRSLWNDAWAVSYTHLTLPTSDLV